jgi:hypothetical protein
MQLKKAIEGESTADYSFVLRMAASKLADQDSAGEVCASL